MKNKPFLLVANWKMYLSYNQAIKHYQEFQHQFASHNLNHVIIICPPTIALASIALQVNKNNNLQWGAQTCSGYTLGAHTGDIDARSLKELNYTYCIVGHSERRAQYNEHNELIAQQVTQLLDHDIIPIICVGETAEERKMNKTQHVITEQLTAIFSKILSENSSDYTLQLDSERTDFDFYSVRGEHSRTIIAYEPRWAIGSDQIPEPGEINDIFALIQKVAHQFNLQKTIKLLYGGSVDAKSIQLLKTIPQLDGFLIGRASIEVQTMKQLIHQLDL